MNLEVLARAIERAPSQVSAIENGKRTPPIQQLQKIAQALGVDYMNISSDQAKQILESRKKKYNGEPAFYFAGTVYIVGDNVNFDTVLHELSHPLLRVISKENPKLFNNLYNSLMATKEGEFIKEHVLKNYPELNEEDTLFKEEALAYALQIKAVNKVTDEIESKGFESFISRLLTALKDLLKMIFGKVSVADIKVDTTIDKLADMLLDKSFKYETDLLTNDDMVGYAREIKEMAQSLLKNVSAEKIQDNINDLYTTNQLIYDKAQNYNTRSPIYQKMIREALFVKGTKELLPKIKKSLSKVIILFGQLNPANNRITFSRQTICHIALFNFIRTNLSFPRF